MNERVHPSFDDRIRQSQLAGQMQLEAYLEAEKEKTPIKASEVSNQIQKKAQEPFSWLPKRLKAPVLAATAGAALLGAACGGNFKADKTYEGGVGAAVVEPSQGPKDVKVIAEPTTPAESNFQKAPDFTLSNPNGGEISLKDFGDGPLIIEFSSECPPCNSEIPKLKEIKDKYADRKLNVLLVSTEPSLVNLSEGLPVAMSRNFEFENLYHPGGAPETYFIKNGEIVYSLAGFDKNSDDLEKLADAFVQGRNMDTVLPTKTPEPMPTPSATKGPETGAEQHEAVINLGDFDLGIIGWREFENVVPNSRANGLQTKHVVVDAVVQNKTEDWQPVRNFKGALAQDGRFELVGSDGQEIDYGSSSAPAVLNTILPIDYGGAFHDPFVPDSDGNVRSIDTISTDPFSATAKYIAPGFGIPLFIDIEVPESINDYSLEFKSIVGAGNKIIKKGQKAENFPLIATDAVISGVNEPVVSANSLGSDVVKLVGSTKGNVDPADAIHPLLLFDVKNNHSVESSPLLESLGDVYLTDGRVIPLEPGSPKLAPNQEEVYGKYLGAATPSKDFPGVRSLFLADSFNFDLKGAVLVFYDGGSWKTWQIPEGANVPVSQGGGE